jgi:MYXO-CTERM domain-containing protein
MRLTSVLASGLAMTATASNAPAAITLFWQHVPITATTDGVTPPPGIQGYQSADLMMTLTPGDDFTSMRIFWNASGPIFQHALGGGAPNFGPPNSGLFPTFPALQFDSYLRGPADGMTVLGSTDGVNDLPPPGIFDGDRIAVAAGDLSTNNTGGTFQLLRVTYQGAPGEVLSAIGRVFSVQDPDGVPLPVPEPAALALAAATGLLAVRRRRV